MRGAPQGGVLMLLACLVLAGALAGGAASAEDAPAVLTLLRAEITRLRDPGQQALALADLAVVLQARGDAGWQKSFADAIESAAQVDEPIAKSVTWRGIAARAWRIAPETALEQLEKALKMARELPYTAQRSLALREIGRSLSDLDKARATSVFAEAVTAAEKIEAPVFRAAALRDLAVAMGNLDAAQAEKLFSAAAAVLAAVQPPDEPVQLARLELVEAWVPTNPEQAMAEAQAVGDGRLQEVCFRRMAEALARVNADGALEVIGRIKDPGQRALALASLAASLAEVQPETAAGLARSAQGMAAGLSDEDVDHLQAQVAVGLAATDLKAALVAVSEIEDTTVAAQALGRVALVVAGSSPAQAVELTTKITDWSVREEAQAQLAPRLAATDLPGALKLVDGILARREKVRALLSILRGLPA